MENDVCLSVLARDGAGPELAHKVNLVTKLHWY